MDLNQLNGGTQSLNCRDCCSAMLDNKKLKQRIIYTNRYCTSCSIDISRAFRACGMKFQHMLEYMDDLELSDVVQGICSRCSTERSSYNFMDFGHDICDGCYTYLLTHNDNLVGSNVNGYVSRERKLRVTNPDSAPSSPQMGGKKKFRRKVTRKEKRLSVQSDVVEEVLNSANVATECQMEMPRIQVSDDNARDTSEQEQHVSGELGSNTVTTDDALAHVIKHTNPLDIKDELTQSAFDGLEPTIVSFLAKPFLIAHGAFTTTDVATTFNQYFTSMAMRLNPAFSEKVRAALGLRYTTVVTLQVNGNRFQQGLYKLCFLPTGGMPIGDNGNVALNNWVNMHRGNRSQISQLMSADLNISSDTSVQLRIPFISAYTACSFTPNMATMVVGDPGYFFLYPYQALKAATGNTAASYSLWVHYEDVEVLGNTAPNVGPAPAALMAEAQSGYRRKASRKNEDFINSEQQQSGPISGGLKIISESAQVLTGIPLLSSYAGTLAWATNAASKAASAFGWSKPIQLNSVERRVARYHNYLASCDQLDDSQPMGLVSTNHINVAPGFAGTDDDEMSVDYLKSIYGIFRVVNWSIAQPAGTELLTFNLAPNELTYNGPGVVAGTINYTPVAYVGTFFEQYSGGFDIKIKIVKTEFHSGRLLFVFNPYESSIATESYTFDDTVYLTKTIIDVREANEFTMRVPFVSLTPWRPVRSVGGDTYSGKYGSIKVFILDNLTAPDTVTADIDLIFEVAGAPDLRFSVPSAFQTSPVVPAELQSGYELPKKINQISADFVGGNNTVDTTFKKEEYCIGETISSLRQCLKRGGYITKARGEGNAQLLTILPWAWDYNLESEMTTRTGSCDPFSRLSSVFALQRGGMRLRWLAESNSGGIYAYIDRRLPNDLAAFPAILTVDLTTPQDVFIHAGVNGQNMLDKAYLGGYAMQVPFYHYNHSACSGSQGIGSNSPYRISLRNGSNLNIVQTYNSQPITYDQTFIYRAGSDDCSFGAFCSVPAMYATPSPFVPPP